MRAVKIKRTNFNTSPSTELEPVNAIFIEYGMDMCEMESSCASYTVGVCELEDGTVELVPCHRFTFVKESK